MADDVQLIRAAARHGRLDELKGYIAKGVDVNVTDEDGATPLLMACCYGHTSCVDVLLKADADPNVSGKHSITPVFFACQENHPSCLKLLIARGANLDTPNSQDGGSPLYIACSKNNVECLRMLCEAGADVNKPRVDGSTGLQTAMRKKHKECVKLCIQYGAEIDKSLPPANKTSFQMAMDMVYAGNTLMRKEYLIGMLEQHEKRDLVAANEKLKAKIASLSPELKSPIVLKVSRPQGIATEIALEEEEAAVEEGDDGNSTERPSDASSAGDASARTKSVKGKGKKGTTPKMAGKKAKGSPSKTPKTPTTPMAETPPPTSSEPKLSPSGKGLDLEQLLAAAKAEDPNLERGVHANDVPDNFLPNATKSPPKLPPLVIQLPVDPPKFAIGSSVYVKRSNGDEEIAVVKSVTEKTKIYTLQLGKAGEVKKEKRTHEDNIRAPSAKECTQTDLVQLMLESQAENPELFTERGAPKLEKPDTYRPIATKSPPKPPPLAIQLDPPKFAIGSSVFVKRSNGEEEIAVVMAYKSKLYTLELGKAGSGKKKDTHEKNIRAADDLA